MNNLVKKVQNFNHLHDLWPSNARIVLAVSGGPDSVCLLDIFAKLARKYPLQLHLAHINYGLRGRDSQKDEQFVEGLAEKYGWPLTILVAPPVSGADLENRLRQIRYGFFEELRARKGFDLIAVGHNADDQAETLLLHLLRGAGLRGLSGMSAKNKRIIRPLLDSSRADILEYLKGQRLKHRLDRSNLAPDFRRNRIRLRLLPYLAKNFDPAVKKILASSARQIAADYAWQQESMAPHLSIFQFRPDSLTFSRSAFLKLPPQLQRSLLRKAILTWRQNLEGLEAGHLDELTKTIRSRKNKSQGVGMAGLKLQRKGDKVVVFY